MYALVRCYTHFTPMEFASLCDDALENVQTPMSPPHNEPLSKLILIIKADLLSSLRWARQHIYSWLILSPIVLGMTYLISTRVIENAREWEFPGVPVKPIAAFVVLALLGASLSRAAGELFGIGHARPQFDALPVPDSVQLHAAILLRGGRTLILTAALLLIRQRLGGELAGSMAAAATFAGLTSLAELWAAINWIHWRHTRARFAGLSSIVTLAPAVLTAGLLLSEAIAPSPQEIRLILTSVGVLSAAVLYVMLRKCHQNWRAADLDYARRLLASRPRTGFNSPLVLRRLSPSAGAQLVRDLQLTMRGFSSAVYAAIGIACLLVAAEFLSIDSHFFPAFFKIEGWLDLTWLPAAMAAKFACVPATVSLASMLPVLVGHELPHLWLERATGTTGLDMFEAKLRYTRLVSLPAPIAAWLIGLVSSQVPISYVAPLLAECLFLWLLVSSFMGAMAFEMPERTGLSFLLMVLTGLALGLLSSFIWPLGLLIFGMAGHSFTQRARIRARYFLMKGAD